MSSFYIRGPDRAQRSCKFLRQTDNRLRVNANKDYASHGDYEGSLQCRRESQWLVIGDPVSEIHHLNKAHVVIERMAQSASQ